MTGHITVHVVGDPVGKGRPRFTRSGRVYTPKQTSAFEDLIAWHARAAMAGRTILGGPVKLMVRSGMPIPESWSGKKRAAAKLGLIWPTSRPDIDNLLKIGADSLNGVVYRDDAQVVIVETAKVYADQPFMNIEVISLERR